MMIPSFHIEVCVVKFIRNKVEWWLPGAGGKGNRRPCSLCTEFQLGKNEGFLEDGQWGGGYAAV